MVKIHYTILMESDIQLYNEEAGNRFLVQNLSMHEEIGQIQYLFCDKTGTLTKNQLVFRHMSVPGQAEQPVLHDSEELNQMLRCICLCHDVLRLDGKLSGSS